MSNLIPYQLTIQAESSGDFKKLIIDLADTLGYLPAGQIPTSTNIVAVDAPVQPAPVPMYAAPQPVPYTPPPQQTAPPQQAFPAAVPTAAPMQQAPAQQPPAAIPTSQPVYDLQQLAVAATALMEAGHDVTGILAQFGVQALTQLPKERYGEFATHIRGLGARI